MVIPPSDSGIEASMTKATNKFKKKNDVEIDLDIPYETMEILVAATMEVK
jgi:hypothetical protein